MSGIAIESASNRVEVLVVGADDEPRIHECEAIGHGHTRKLTPIVRRALERAGIGPADLSWVAADLGPGSFTGVRVGLATARALALASGARLHGASSLAALALSCGARRALVVPLIPAGRRDVYAGYFRADARGKVVLLSAPRVGRTADVIDDVAERLPLLGRGVGVRFVGPAVPRERGVLEETYPSSTSPAWRHDGLSAVDLAVAARSGRGPAAGLPAADDALRPVYVRSAQAEERVRHRALAGQTIELRDMAPRDISAIAAVEREVFSDPWPESFFLAELGQPGVIARVAEWKAADAPPDMEPQLAGYFVAWLGEGLGHLGNLAVVPGLRRHGIATVMVHDLFAAARRAGSRALTLEVRASNAAAQALYRVHGFRVAGLRRGYYRDSGEDAVLMEWRAPLPGEPNRHA